MAAEPERVFQISGIRNAETKRSLLKCISSLGGIYAGGSAYSERTTHLIARNVSPSEKFLAACAAGIWVLRPEYVTESARAGRWLAEEPREWGSPARRWRGQAGAFRGWRVALLLGDAGKRKVFERILKAGKATVYHCPPSTQEFTHVLVKNMRQETPPCGAPCYSLNYIAQHLFEVRSREGEDPCCSGRCGPSGAEGVRETESPRAMPPPLSPDAQQRLFSELELKLKEHVLALEKEIDGLRKVTFPRSLTSAHISSFVPPNSYSPSKHLNHQCSHRLSQVFAWVCSAAGVFQWFIIKDKRAKVPLEKNLKPIQNSYKDPVRLRPIALRTRLLFLSLMLWRNLKGAVICLNIDVLTVLRIRVYVVLVPTILSTLHDITDIYPCVVMSHHSIRDTQCFTRALEVTPPVSKGVSKVTQTSKDAESPLFVITFLNTLHDVFRNNPPWGWPSRVGYFLSLLQCPECKEGPWAFLEASASHRAVMQAAPRSPCFSAGGRSKRLPKKPEEKAVSLPVKKSRCSNTFPREPGGGMSSVLVHTFWNVWEKSTLATKPLQQLAKLLVEATQWLLASKEAEVSRPDVVSTLHEIFGVAVEFWRQDNSRLNRDLAEKGMKDFADYLSILWQEDSSPEVLVELVTSLQSPWLKMFVADAIYRHLCSKSCIAVGPEPLSLHKILYNECLCCMGPPWPAGAVQTRVAFCSIFCVLVLGAIRVYKQYGLLSVLVGHGLMAGPPFSCFPRGQKRYKGKLTIKSNSVSFLIETMNFAPYLRLKGETLLHRVCKQNQAEKLITILSLPGTDINVKDHAGWTPLHEACNHGSAACVRAILRLCPGVDLLGPAGGLSPLQDALLAGHADVAGLLLRHA
uniref:SMC5-SMC6 complex localization factor 1 n=1 Tax=Lepisosteus oculatus TaxID=7918 RepID=W5M0D4_LEPOC